MSTEANPGTSPISGNGSVPPGSPLDLEVTLARPASPAGSEPEDSVFARLRLQPRGELAARPQLDFCFVLDASASMHRFVLNPEQRAYWRHRAEQRGEISRQTADGRAGLIWSGQTLRELQQVVSTPMISTLRGVWRTLEALHLTDRVGILAFADQFAVVYEDAGVADANQRLEAAKLSMSRLGSGVDESGLGRGTRLSAALHHALERLSVAPNQPVLRRMVLVSDGIIEDADACRTLIDRAVDRGLVISVIGVGDDFDEEFLMMVADLTRGNYYYAATAPEVEQAVSTELAVVARVVALRGVVRVQPDAGTIVRDLYPIAPQMSEFQTAWVENGGWRFRIGDVSLEQPQEFLLELAPASHPGGQVRLGTVRVEGVAPATAEGFAAEAPVNLFYSDEAMLLQARDDEVLDAVGRLEIYLEERRAAAAVAKGDTEGATKHLKAATRMLRSRGDEDLAEEMDAAAEETEAGTRNLGRSKRVKAGTRRLGQGGRQVRQEARAEPGDTRQLGKEAPAASPAPSDAKGGSETRQLR